MLFLLYAKFSIFQHYQHSAKLDHFKRRLFILKINTQIPKNLAFIQIALFSLPLICVVISKNYTLILIISIVLALIVTHTTLIIAIFYSIFCF